MSQGSSDNSQTRKRKHAESTTNTPFASFLGKMSMLIPRQLKSWYSKINISSSPNDTKSVQDSEQDPEQGSGEVHMDPPAKKNKFSHGNLKINLFEDRGLGHEDMEDTHEFYSSDSNRAAEGTHADANDNATELPKLNMHPNDSSVHTSPYCFQERSIRRIIVSSVSSLESVNRTNEIKDIDWTAQGPSIEKNKTNGNMGGSGYIRTIVAKYENRSNVRTRPYKTRDFNLSSQANMMSVKNNSKSARPIDGSRTLPYERTAIEELPEPSKFIQSDATTNASCKEIKTVVEVTEPSTKSYSSMIKATEQSELCPLVPKNTWNCQICLCKNPNRRVTCICCCSRCPQPEDSKDTPSQRFNFGLQDTSAFRTGISKQKLDCPNSLLPQKATEKDNAIPLAVQSSDCPLPPSVPAAKLIPNPIQSTSDENTVSSECSDVVIDLTNYDRETIIDPSANEVPNLSEIPNPPEHQIPRRDGLFSNENAPDPKIDSIPTTLFLPAKPQDTEFGSGSYQKNVLLDYSQKSHHTGFVFGTPSSEQPALTPTFTFGQPQPIFRPTMQAQPMQTMSTSPVQMMSSPPPMPAMDSQHMAPMQLQSPLTKLSVNQCVPQFNIGSSPAQQTPARKIRRAVRKSNVR